MFVCSCVCTVNHTLENIARLESEIVQLKTNHTSFITKNDENSLHVKKQILILENDKMQLQQKINKMNNEYENSQQSAKLNISSLEIEHKRELIEFEKKLNIMQIENEKIEGKYESIVDELSKTKLLLNALQLKYSFVLSHPHTDSTNKPLTTDEQSIDNEIDEGPTINTSELYLSSAFASNPYLTPTAHMSVPMTTDDMKDKSFFSSAHQPIDTYIGSQSLTQFVQRIKERADNDHTFALPVIIHSHMHAYIMSSFVYKRRMH